MKKIGKLFENLVWFGNKNRFIEAILNRDEDAVAQMLARFRASNISLPVDLSVAIGPSAFGVTGSCLHLAVYMGSARIVQLLLDAGMDVNAKDSRGDTALHYAVGRDHLAIVRALLDCNANPNAQGWCARVPMMPNLLGQASVSVISALLEAGADSCAKDNDGHCPRTVYLSPEIQRLFVEHDAKLARETLAEAFAEAFSEDLAAPAAQRARGLSI